MDKMFHFISTTIIFLFLSFFRSEYLLSIFLKNFDSVFLCVFSHTFLMQSKNSIQGGQERLGGLSSGDIRTQKKKNDWLIDKCKWIFVIEALLHLKTSGFR